MPRNSHASIAGLTAALVLTFAANGCVGSTDLRATPVAGIYSNITGALFGDDSIQARAWAVGSTGDSLTEYDVALSALTPLIATITSAGVIHTRRDGLALFLATTEGFVDTISLRVFVTRVARITATPDSASLVAGDSLDLGDARCPFVIHVFDATGHEMQDVPVFLRSSDSRVVMTTSYYYEIIARGFGEAVLTAMADTASTNIKITVKGSD